MLGVAFDKVTAAEAMQMVAAMIRSGQPHYAATPNVDFVVQALADAELRRILAEADLVLCDGMPLVWASRFLGNPLPERVAGSDLVPQLLAQAEQEGWRVFFLGGTEHSVAQAADKVRTRHPALKLVGAYSPPFAPLLAMDHDDILRRVRAAKPDILLVALGCPKQEKWIRMNYRRAGVPLSIGVGATIDFLAGSVRRAPGWMQATGLEWLFRLLQEPRRLFRRYSTDLWVFGRAILQQWWQLRGLRRHQRKTGLVVAESTLGDDCEIVHFTERVDAAVVQQYESFWAELGVGRTHLLLDLARVEFMDSTGVGLLVRLHKTLSATQRKLVLVRPTQPVVEALNLMRLTAFFIQSNNLAAARALIRRRLDEHRVVATLDLAGEHEPVAWQGDIMAANEAVVWHYTRLHLAHSQGRQAEMNINLAAVGFMDSAGVRLMVRTRKEARRLGLQLKFTQPTPAVRHILRVLRLENFLIG